MKKLSLALALLALLTACSNEKKKDDKMPVDKKDEKKMSDNITYPYKADYSSDFSLGDPNHAKMVLDFYKAWEENKMDDMKPMLNDSVWVHFNDGNKFSGTSDSLIKFGKEYRATFSRVSTTVDGWIPVHSNDRNEDFVLIWVRDYNTDQKGKLDSVAGHAYFQIRNNKIAGWGEYQQKMGPPPPMTDK